jgi:hypothetical protein
VVAGLLAERFPQGGDVPVQISFFDETVRPDVFNKLFFCYNLAGMLQQQNQNPKDGWSYRRTESSPAQKELSGVYAKIIKLVNGSLCQHAADCAGALPRANSLNSFNPWLI